MRRKKWFLKRYLCWNYIILYFFLPLIKKQQILSKHRKQINDEKKKTAIVIIFIGKAFNASNLYDQRSAKTNLKEGKWKSVVKIKQTRRSTWDELWTANDQRKNEIAHSKYYNCGKRGQWCEIWILNTNWEKLV